ncbi:MAG: M20/M25/M40 family metallo-hydrolase [Caldilineaceae bacterium]|nr:M20/M25/M40 family metallo-hydrolase [Caldilineaceae bacterium]
MTQPTQTAAAYAAANQARFYAQLLDLIRLPSVSTQPEHADDVAAAAAWLADDMRAIGMETAEVIRMPEGRHPLVLGTWSGAGPDAPTVLIYSHYDVQPAAMADGWDSPPFTPTERDGKLYARGATDSKVNLMSQLKAVEALLATGGAPVNIKLLFEGEEESGSENINAFAAAHADRLRADACVICDGGIVAPDQPSLDLGLRGVVTMELRVDGPVRDLHSGIYGGSVHNPLQALCEIVAQLHDADGRVNVPGFYDEVYLPDAEERALLAGLNPWIEADWARVANPPGPWGEPGFSIHERTGMRPTLEINGLRGGYADAGFKTVLPAYALAKISCRLVPYQDPGEIFALVQERIAAVAPPSVTATLTRLDEGAPAVRMPADTRAMRAAAAAYTSAWGVAPVYELAGGSVPIASTLAGVTEEMVKMSFGYKGGQNHGPNEHIVIGNFPRSVQAAIAFLNAFAAG